MADSPNAIPSATTPAGSNLTLMTGILHSFSTAAQLPIAQLE
jgi:hypothetical protein